jgi:hypothetical protein
LHRANPKAQVNELLVLGTATDAFAVPVPWKELKKHHLFVGLEKAWRRREIRNGGMQSYFLCQASRIVGASSAHHNA